MARQLARNEYTVGWVCVLPIELAAAEEMLDEEHKALEDLQDENDDNIYSVGSICGHNVVIGCLPAGRTGNNSAAAVATQMKATFRGLRFGLMVGIGGGVPSAEVDIRLGDVVVGQPNSTFGGVVQYDFGKTNPSGFERTGHLNSPPSILLSAIARVRAREFRRKSRLSEHVSNLSATNSQFLRENAGEDVLFEATYNHEDDPTKPYNLANAKDRKARPSELAVHYGTIASGNQVMKYGVQRDNVSADLGGVLCFEMEAAGLMNTFPCLVIRGICDYADSHKNKRWQSYAAGTAAGYAKEVLCVIPPPDVTKIRTLSETSNDTRPPVHYIPFLRNRQFTGRGTTLQELRQRLLIDGDCQKVSLAGLGGIGKTQVALEFVYALKENRPEYSIFWVSALSSESFQQACDEILRELRKSRRIGGGSDANVKEIMQSYLSSKQAGKWLLVLDNADDEELLFNNHAEQSRGMANYLPQSEDGLILITTRHQEIALSLARSNVLELVKMDQDERQQMFEKLLIRKDLAHDEPILTELLDELNSIPLAMTQAASYINTNKITLSRYLKLLRNTEQDLANLITKEFRDDTRYAKSVNAIARTWAVSFEQIRRHDAAAMELFSFMSCIEPKAIPRSMLPALQPEERLESAIGTLCAYSFIVRRDDNDVYDIHSLVHTAKKLWVKDNGLARKITAEAIDDLADAFPYVSFETQPVWRLYLPHVVRICQQGREIETETWSRLCLSVVHCLMHDGRYKEAVAWAEEACGWTEKSLKEDHPVRLESQFALAYTYDRNGQIPEAVPLLEHVVATSGRTLSEDHPSLLLRKRQLSRTYLKSAQVPEAIQLLKYVVATYGKIMSENHPELLSSRHDLAVAYAQNGQVSEAVQLLEHVVEIRSSLAEDHPEQLVSQHELASVYHTNGQLAEAIQLLEHVVEIRSSLAEDHPARLSAQYELARVYHTNGQIAEAIQLLEHVTTINQTLAEDHPNRLSAQHELASAYHVNGQIAEAIQLLEYVVKVRSALAEDNAWRLTSQHELASAYHANGQIAEAIQLLEHVTTINQTLAEDHPNRLMSQHELARAYHANGQVAEAIQLLEHVTAVRETLAEDHPGRLASRHELARAYHTNGQKLEAVRLLEHVVNVQRVKLAQDHPNRLILEEVLAMYHMDLRNGSQE